MRCAHTHHPALAGDPFVSKQQNTVGARVQVAAEERRRTKKKQREAERRWEKSQRDTAWLARYKEAAAMKAIADVENGLVESTAQAAERKAVIHILKQKEEEARAVSDDTAGGCTHSF